MFRHKDHYRADGTLFTEKELAQGLSSEPVRSSAHVPHITIVLNKFLIFICLNSFFIKNKRYSLFECNGFCTSKTTNFYWISYTP
jgi:hypothetical protein